VGLSLASAPTGAGDGHRYWYAELDARTGKLVRAADLATLGEGSQLEIVGADAGGTSAWFAITEVTPRRRVLVLRRLDLGTLEVRDEQRVLLRPRAGTQHAVTVHAAADFSRFAIVEYVENAVGMAPGNVYVAEPAAGTAFAVPAPPTAYGVAFSADGKYIYLGSAQQGTIARIDVAGRRIDKQVAAPRYLHHLVISPSGTKLFVFASASTYAVYDLPDLKVRTDAAHPTGVAPAMVELHGNGIASLDGAFFVVPDVEDRRKPARDRGYVIARLVD
jgi:streptogramin lyase